MEENARPAEAAKNKHWQCVLCNKSVPQFMMNEHNMSKKHLANITQMQLKKKTDYAVSSQGVFIHGIFVKLMICSLQRIYYKPKHKIYCRSG
jgi:hypothetical protein